MESPTVKRRKIDETPYTPIYPTLPVEESPEQQGHSYRLHEISLFKRQLEDEREKLASLYKKYHRGVNVIDGVNTALLTASMGVGGAGLLVTIIAAPTVFALECASWFAGFSELRVNLSIAAWKVNRRSIMKSVFWPKAS